MFLMSFSRRAQLLINYNLFPLLFLLDHFNFVLGFTINFSVLIDYVEAFKAQAAMTLEKLRARHHPSSLTY